MPRAPRAAPASARAASASAPGPSPAASPAPAGRCRRSCRRSGRAARRPPSRAAATTVENRFSPARWATLTCSTSVAFPHGCRDRLHVGQRTGERCTGTVTASCRKRTGSEDAVLEPHLADPHPREQVVARVALEPALRGDRLGDVGDQLAAAPRRFRRRRRRRGRRARTSTPPTRASTSIPVTAARANVSSGERPRAKAGKPSARISAASRAKPSMTTPAAPRPSAAHEKSSPHDAQRTPVLDREHRHVPGPEPVEQRSAPRRTAAPARRCRRRSRTGTATPDEPRLRPERPDRGVEHLLAASEPVERVGDDRGRGALEHGERRRVERRAPPLTPRPPRRRGSPRGGRPRARPTP